MNEQLINAGILAQAKSASGRGILVNPAEIPQQLVLNGTIAAAATKTSFYVNDSCGLATQLAQVSTESGQAMTAGGGVSIDNVREFLKTHALIIAGYNFEASRAALLQNNLKLIYSSLDGNAKTVQLFSAKSVSNMANNPLLLNIRQSFVYTNTCALKITVASDATDATDYAFTFDIIAAVPYGQLDAFLAMQKIPTSVAL